MKSEKGKAFSYKDMRKVYTIIFFEKTEKEYDFINFEGRYIHHGSTVFDTGIKINLLQEYWLIALDGFRKTTYPKDKSEQTAWISLLATEDVGDIDRLVAEYPWIEEIYREISEYLVKPEEVLSMFSEALRIMDRNTVKYMMEELEKKIDEKNDRLMQMDAELQEKDKQLAEQQEEIERLKRQLAEK